MKKTILVSDKAVDLVARFEGFRSEAYLCPSGVWTMGYGLTEAAGIGVKVGPGRTISEPHARRYLHLVLAKFVWQILPYLVREPSENQLAAMLSLAYNIGPNAFRRSSVLRCFNAAQDGPAADAFLLWNKASGKVLRGLTARRMSERALYLAK